MIAPFREQLEEGASNEMKNIVAVITQDRVIDDKLKRQIKNQTVYTFKLFLLS